MEMKWFRPQAAAASDLAPSERQCRDTHGNPIGRRQPVLASYVWLAYSAFFFIEPFFRHSGRYWLQCMIVYAVFLVIYTVYVQTDHRRLRLSMMAGMFLLGLGFLMFNSGAACFFIYVAAMLPFSVRSMKVLVGVMLVEELTLYGVAQFKNNIPIDYLISGIFIIVAGVSNAFVAAGKRADQKLRDAQDENLELAAVAERERIARDLHDVLGHTLSVIVLKAELAGRLMGRDDVRAAKEIADVEKTARLALAEVREAIGGYRAKGLTAEVEQARQTLDAAGVALLCDSPVPSLRPREETVLSLAVREAVTNIVRHARATECTMSFKVTQNGFAQLEVSDNGRAKAGPEGNGLRGMRERVQELGGNFRIESNAGTRLVIELPYTSLQARIGQA